MKIDLATNEGFEELNPEIIESQLQSADPKLLNQTSARNLKRPERRDLRKYFSPGRMYEIE